MSSLWYGEEAWNSYSLQNYDKRPPAQYRSTPPGEPTVADLVAPGDTIRTISDYSSSPRDYLVQKVFRDRFCGGCCNDDCAYNMPDDHPYVDDPTEECFPVPHYRLNGTTDSSSGKFYLSEFVAVGGRILHVFPANTNEIVVVKRVPRQLSLL